MTDDNIELSNIFKDLDPMFWKNGRLQTYKYWPFSLKEQCNANSMSAAGFFCVGGEDEPDLVECFMCCKQLDGWESNDDPWEEHKKHQPNCQFMQLNKPDEDSLTVTELFKLIQNYYKQKNKLELENSIKALKSEWKETATLIPDIYDALKKSKKSTDSDI